jgi:hypothetical protein
MKKRIWPIIVCVCCTMNFLLLTAIHAQNIQVVSYGANPGKEYLSVFLKMVNLPSANAVDSLFLSDGGTIITPIPIKMNVRDSLYYLIFVSKGEFDKNTYVGDRRVCWWIINGTNQINLVKSDSFVGATIRPLSIYPDQQTFSTEISNEETGQVMLKDGLYDLDSNFNFHYVDSLKPERKPLRITNQGDYHQINNLNEPNVWNLYSAEDGDGQSVILRLNAFNDMIIGSLRLSAPFKMSKIFAYHPVRDKLYCFFLNYMHRSRYEDLIKVYGQDWGSPEVVIYDPHTLVELDRIKIADCTEEDYAGIAFGTATVEGDFIIHYYSDTEDLVRFEPAMLFIFDTRTNEARWLRVGWR